MSTTFVSRFAPAAHSNLVIGRCSECRRVVRTEIAGIVDDLYARVGHIGRIGGCLVGEPKKYGWAILCSRFPGGCERGEGRFVGQIEFQRVNHKVRKAAPTKCNGACQGASGPNCDCECGGANHGGAHHGV